MDKLLLQISVYIRQCNIPGLLIDLPLPKRPPPKQPYTRSIEDCVLTCVKRLQQTAGIYAVMLKLRLAASYLAYLGLDSSVFVWDLLVLCDFLVPKIL